MTKLIPAKLLLAGEFTVLIGGDTMGIPFFRYSGKWVKTETIDQRLLALHTSLIIQAIDFLDLESFQEDIENGWLFYSNIPEGYGLGSSGALSAAILSKYGNDQDIPIEVTQKRLAAIEAYYHGKSSGFDPLISYTAGICQMHKGISKVLDDVKVVDKKLHSHLYLIDSKTLRNSIVPIDWFFQQLDQRNFKDTIDTLNTLNDELIRSLMDEFETVRAQTFQQISRLQYEYFQPLIVDTIKKLWLDGINKGTHYCKLCGKGGGGYYFLWLNVPHQEFTQLYPNVELIPLF